MVEIKRVKATKQIMRNGNSLTINVTQEVKKLGLDQYDYVDITLQRNDEEEDDTESE